ncbi:MAG: type II toxin-antitoxin system RelE/ParE family toxin [Selenomonas sp.]|uniref:type II toxin-antitoxin system RelE/ParE family toxin n=1 Tax=Selenomonas sp. TaxID=2053611 RepID=UPI0025EBA8BD|nr:type II toxin-antitoxin system RelE/ParE family toxin [Selenomonas sp.]MCI6100551.1 type II toxin-antitoxin system RelE/ParE family toxin [Selenomonas sp.]MCI6232433.1 type II toxin-antitoxin system RelE/ParE family toxin [Selenomonas sp.]
MDTYEIIITPDAEEDLRCLCDYIADTLMAPETARAFLQMLRGEIQTLSELPERTRLVDAEPWHSRGVRKLFVKNFIIYYRVDQEEHRVYVLNVIYGRRSQLKALKDRESL